MQKINTDRILVRVLDMHNGTIPLAPRPRLQNQAKLERLI